MIPGVGSSVGFSFECLGYRHSPCHAIAGESKFTEKADTVPGGGGPLAAQVKRFVDGEIRGFCSCSRKASYSRYGIWGARYLWRWGCTPPDTGYVGGM